MDLKWLSRLAATASAALVFTTPALADNDNDRPERVAEIVVAELLGGQIALRGADRDDDRHERNRDWDHDHDDDDDWRDRDRDHDRDDRDWRNRDRDRDNDDWRGRDDDDWRFGGNRGGAVILYEDPNFRGDRFPINGAVPNFRRTGFDDEASSIRVNRGMWLACTDPNYRGNCVVFRADQSAFARHGLNDRISSIRPASANEARRYADNDFGFGNNRGWGDDRDWGSNGGFGGADLVVYVDPNGRGRSLRINNSIRYLRDLGFNDNISSIQVNSGRWEICSDPDYRGRCKVIDQSVGYTLNIGLNDNISSIRRVDGRGNGGWSW